MKGATSVKAYYHNDVAVQALVLQGCGLKLASMQLRHVNNKFTYQGDEDYAGLLTSVDISKPVIALLPGIGAQKDSFMAMLDGDLPEIAMGGQCNSPFECEFCSFCQPDDLPELKFHRF